jgi:hypothetical protein
MIMNAHMKTRPDKSTAEKITAHWDSRDFLDRLKMILDNRGLFQSLGLVTSGELTAVSLMSESALEYIIRREEQPIFTSINIKKDVEAQHHRKKLKAALRAVFCNQKT